MLSQLFAFGHPDYSRYLTYNSYRRYQHALLEVHLISNTSIWKGLKENSCEVGSLTVGKSSTKHGDLIIETTGKLKFEKDLFKVDIGQN